MSPKSLFYHSQLKVYYLLYDVIVLVQTNGFWYCFCDLTPGCKRENGHNCWCLLCILQ